MVISLIGKATGRYPVRCRFESYIASKPQKGAPCNGWGDMNSCVGCSIEFRAKKGSTGKYCSSACMGAHSRQKVIDAWLRGEDPGWSGITVVLKSAVRSYILELADYACSVCGWDKRHPIDGKPLVEIDHVDGNAKNCKPDNLVVLCPNCHSMTPTFRARNKVSARKR